MKINKKELEQALALVKPGLASKESIEQSTSFVFSQGKVITFNDEISIAHPVKDLELEGAIHADEFYNFISKVKKEEIEMTLANGQILFTTVKTKAGLTLQEKILLPLKSIGKKGKWYDLPADFLHYLSLAIGSCSNDMNRPILTCVNITKEGKIIGSDSYRLMLCDMEQEMPVDTFLLPAEAAVQVVKLKPNKIAAGEGWVHFQTEKGTELSCRVFEDTYPNTSAYETIEGVELSFPKTMPEILDEVWVFAKRDHILDEMIIITVDNNRMKVKAKSDTGWIEKEANLKYDNEKVTFSITPYLLRDILKETYDFMLSDNAIIFQGTGWKYISMLRMGGE